MYRTATSLTVAVTIVACSGCFQSESTKPAVIKCWMDPSGIDGLVKREPISAPDRNSGSAQNWAGVPNATIIIRDSKDKEVMRTKTDKSGNFSLNLKPGDYTVLCESPNQSVPGQPNTQSIKVKVPVGPRQRADFKFDTGIR